MRGPQLQGPHSGTVLDSVCSGQSSRQGSDSAQGDEVVMRAVPTLGKTAQAVERGGGKQHSETGGCAVGCPPGG